MARRGTYDFDIDSNGNLADSVANLERLRALFRDGRIIADHWGPGDAGDFDHGAWHILCHLAAGGALLETARGPAWLGISWDGMRDLYMAVASIQSDDRVENLTLESDEGGALLASARPLAFVEGTSQGHVTARGVQDPPDAFNGCPRQEFDRDVTDPGEGGVVWEHWCTTRDIRPQSVVGTSVLSAFLTLVSVLGGCFVAPVARGRRDHQHPRQLAALIRAGVLTREEALWDTSPLAIPPRAQRLFYEARPICSLEACRWLDLHGDGEVRYFMFARRIRSWSPTEAVARDLRAASE